MEFGAVVHQMHIWLMGELKEPFQEDFSHIEATVNLTSCDMFEPPWMMSKCKDAKSEVLLWLFGCKVLNVA